MSFIFFPLTKQSNPPQNIHYKLLKNTRKHQILTFYNLVAIYLKNYVTFVLSQNRKYIKWQHLFFRKLDYSDREPSSLQLS